MYDAPNAVEELKQPRKHPTAEKVEAIKDALRYFEVIEKMTSVSLKTVVRLFFIYLSFR